MRDFDCLAKGVDLFGNHFIEASAGTGKTFAMEHVVCRLLLTSDLSIREILVVTFTRAATRELSARIASTLRQVLKELKDGHPSLPYLEDFLGDAQAIFRIDRALKVFDEAQIFTIHGFCYKMLAEFPFESGVDVSHSDPDETPYEKALEEAITDFFRSVVKPPKYHACQVEALLSLARGSFSRLLGLISGLLTRDWSGERGLAWDVGEEKCVGVLANIPTGFLNEFEELAGRFKGVCDATGVPRAGFLDLAKKIEKRDPSFLAGDTGLFALLQVENLKKGKEVPLDGPLMQGVEMLAPLALEVREPKRVLKRLVEEARPVALESLQKKGIVLPDQLLSLMEGKLQNRSFFDGVSEKYQVAVVDEFQDTDRIQWGIFRRLFLERKCRAFYVVGDPKQSIYGFRSADLATYFAAQKSFGEGSLFSLRTNFRSEPAVIDALNTAFSEEKAAGWLEEMRYSPVLARGSEENSDFSDGLGALHVALFPIKRGRERSWPPARAENDFIFPYIVTEIMKLKSEGSFTFSDFAILIKDRFQATRLETFFKKCGIPVQAKGVMHIASTRIYLLFEKILAVLSDPRDISAMKLLLGSPFAHYTCGELTGELEEERIIFMQLAGVMESEGFASFVSKFLDTEFRGMKVVHHLVSEGDLSDYADFMHLSDLLMEKAMHGYGTVEVLAEELRRMQGVSLDEDPRLRRRQMESEKGVQVMTTHMSKGLEFEFVFALGMTSRTTQKDLVEAGGYDKVGEKMRQFYVALTRAKRRVYLPCVLDEGGEVSREEAAPAELYLRAVTGRDVLDCSSVCEALGDISHEVVRDKREVLVSAPAVQELAPPERIDLLFPQKSVVSFTSLARVEEGERKEAPEGVLPLGAMTGVIFHSILEKAIDRGIYADRGQLKRFVDHEIHGTHLLPWNAEVFQLIDAAFDADLGGFCLREVDPGMMLTEVAFSYGRSAQEEMKGFADLVFCHDGKYHLVDWKTNYLGESCEEYAVENLTREMERHDYFFQSRIYSEAIKKYLNVIESRSYEEIFGCAHYVFLRGLKWKGCGTLSFSPEMVTL